MLGLESHALQPPPSLLPVPVPEHLIAFTFVLAFTALAGNCIHLEPQQFGPKKSSYSRRR